MDGVRFLRIGVCLIVMVLGIAPVWAEVNTIHAGVSVDAVQPPVEEPGVVGVTFDMLPQRDPVVSEVFPGTPAAGAGVRVGDILLGVNRLSTKGLSLTQLDQAISDRPGEVVQFLIKRQGQLLTVKLTVAALSQIQPQQTRRVYSNLFGN